MRHTQLVLQQLAFALVSINAYGQPAFLSSPRDLLATDPSAVVQWLDANRPKPVPAPNRAVFLSRLPAEGEVVDFDESARRKLAGLTRFLERAERGSVYEIKVVDLAFARLATYERTAILVSQAVLTLLDGEELQALVAHEIGHEYVADDYNRAFASRDRRRLKDLELLCDAIGTVTLLKLGIDPSRLITAADRIRRYNRAKSGSPGDESAYPTLAERRQFARAVTAWMNTASGQIAAGRFRPGNWR
jgi:hypothetical protein